MTLSPGARLGPYEVLDPIGAGGMGEVYRARDTRLDRTVAVKVLPPDFADDPSRRARFEREARAISALEHPHICTLHDVGEQEGLAYLVMEYLAGETLAGRLTRGPLPRSQALQVASQIADALDAAHKRGIVHRDLKPSNVMLTGAGVKLLDFGLARVHSGAGAVESTSPTLTETGAVLGTAPYMSPEQVEGREADTRSDIWSLGVVLYEMLTGRRAFAGTNTASLIAAILERDPVSLTTLQPLTPPPLERLVRRCLAKSPDDRWGTAHDLADELRWVAQGAGVTGDVGTRVPGQPPTWRRLAVTAIAAVLIGLGVGLSVGLRFARAPSRLSTPPSVRTSRCACLPTEDGSRSRPRRVSPAASGSTTSPRKRGCGRCPTPRERCSFRAGVRTDGDWSSPGTGAARTASLSWTLTATARPSA